MKAIDETPMDATHEHVILDPSGRPARRRQAQDKTCPQCGSGPEKREASGGFGPRHPQCGHCGYQWVHEVWRD